MIQAIRSKFLQTAPLLIIALLWSCSADKIISHKVARQFKNSEVIKQYNVGFALYNIGHKKMLFQKDADKYFTPASNTKLYTFYASLKMLPGSIPALKYIEQGDSLIFWGTGDPSFLQTELKDKTVYNFLSGSNKSLFFAPGRYSGNFFGSGWSWDDYNDYYQAEINELPIFDNTVWVKATGNGRFSVSPKNFWSCFTADSTKTSDDFFVKRKYNTNEFVYNSATPKANYNQQIPFKVSTATTLSLLADTLHKTVGLINLKIPKNVKTIYSANRDSVLRHMLQPSDNFIAEQLLLLCSDQISDTLSTEKAIDYVLKNYLSSLPDKPRWVDGSGLSRMNLFTPRDMVKLLDLIYEEIKDEKKLFSMLAAGGQSGTLKYAYPKTNNPFVFAKTGSLTGIHNQSGYVITKKGNTYIYSFMNNNFVLPTADVKKEMVRIVTYIHDNF
ncbi:D-alanyl-D-alanine carboxypeptidase/D-alanyl-D-alanine-endopeptidase [Pedobacter punctiformis]|uniref:D-alanyl-D-alanine carboxypeptidase n=1 Tax=Pedobacter punctiformis TaxID=3004097 RepID=A0ABT4L5D3_9SPHI|nr:D-alanyl-D-alanine carboxypeptidase [Pedobacter sp. HCMS5-2]MCZ4243121.1 D-alanyl-D-alanine carboxypeptidase [Pedobacter sp. HCMS5-2]